MKEKNKPMLIGGGIGLAAGVGASFLIGKKDTKNIIMFAAIGVVLGLAGGYFLISNPTEEKSGFDKSSTRWSPTKSEFDNNSGRFAPTKSDRITV